ncbi:MAG: hypothetical protein FJZ98_02445 [Chloroflexi bacterium]|nr:hypothetical protein [Chloroflexota bacterium]
MSKNIGLDTIFMYAWRDREIVLQMMEDVSGGRVSHAINMIGGVRKDLEPEHIESMRMKLPELLDRVRELIEVLEHDRTFQARTRGIGYLSLEDVKRFCVVGPVARASGLDMDIRRDQPYARYSGVSFDVPIMREGDIWARALIRLYETIQSINICNQILEKLPSGEISSRAARKVPPGEVVSRAEGPRGEVIYFIKSDGTQNPFRVKIRTPTLTALITLPQQLKGMQLADVSAIIAGVDLCIACADR